MNPLKLPVYRHRTKILKALQKSQVIVVESPTGSGKTTQIPQILYNEGFAEHGIIGVTQPRRIAAVSVSRFIAEQVKTRIPRIVGYKMRFEDMTDQSTKIKIMTDGILLQELKADYSLSKYSVIMVDEAHERSLNIDFILGLLKNILNIRPKFKVIVSSATINAEVFSEYFDGCPIVKIESEAFPVETKFTPPVPENDTDAMFKKILEIVEYAEEKKIKGDILIFLSGERTIKECITVLKHTPFNRKLKILPLYSRLSTEEQENVFKSCRGKRKIIVATNIAETSITIDGITIVIDSGYAKMNYFHPDSYTSSLVEIPISRASCNQRKGRAGRTRPGICYRLYSEKDYSSRPLFTTEEIYRTDLSEVILRMAEIGISEFENFDFISPPGKQEISSALDTLRLLEAVDENRGLTEIGRMMTQFPILPKHSRIIAEAVKRYPSVMEEVITAVSFLTSSSPFLLPQGEELEARKAHHNFRDPYGDFYSYIRLLKGYVKSRDRDEFCIQYYLEAKTMKEILNIKYQLEEIVSDMGIPVLHGGSIADYLCAVSRGLIQSVCIRTGKNLYRSLTAEKIQIHPGSVMFKKTPDYMVAGEIVRTSRRYARSVSPLKENWLERIYPSLPESLKARKYASVRIRKKKDFTNKIKIGPEVFPITMEKGRNKVVILDWHKISTLAAKLNPDMLTDYKKLKGKVVFKEYEIFSGQRLNTILKIIPKLDRNKLRIIPKWDSRNLKYPEDADRIFANLDSLLCLCRARKKSKKLGFLTLVTEGGGVYWFRCIQKYYSAVSGSLSGLESLIDEDENLIKKSGYKDKINKHYRMLSEILDT